MDSPNTPQGLPQGIDFDAKARALLQVKHEMQVLHAQLVYLRLILKLSGRLSQPR